MHHNSETLSFATPGRSTTDITAEVAAAVGRAGVSVGICHVFCMHTSASLIICENADATVRSDLERFAARWAPDGDPTHEHSAEGPDDMPAHLRSVFTNTDLTLPIRAGRLALGTWQGLYLWEHRTSAHRRQIIVTVQGDR